MPADMEHERRIGSEQARWRYDIEKKLAKHHQDFYEGNGKPSFTTRLQIMEDTCARITASLQKITWLVVSTLLAVVGGIIVRLILRGK